MLAIKDDEKRLRRGAQGRGEKPARAGTTTAAEPNETAEHSNGADWTKLVRRIAAGEAAAMQELYTLFSHGIRFYLCRQLGPQELDDKVHDTFVIVVQAIQKGELREPDRLMGFVRTVVRRQVAAYIDEAVHVRRDMTTDAGPFLADSRRNPEQTVALRQRVQLMREVLAELSDRDRDILTRFYLNEQTQEQICREMDLSGTQFRLLKSRAKARFGDLGRKRLQQRNLMHILLRATRRISHFTDDGDGEPRGER